MNQAKSISEKRLWSLERQFVTRKHLQSRTGLRLPCLPWQILQACAIYSPASLSLHSSWYIALRTRYLHASQLTAYAVLNSQVRYEAQLASKGIVENEQAAFTRCLLTPADVPHLRYDHTARSARIR